MAMEGSCYTEVVAATLGVRTNSVSYIKRVDEVSWLYFSYTKMRRL